MLPDLFSCTCQQPRVSFSSIISSSQISWHRASSTQSGLHILQTSCVRRFEYQAHTDGFCVWLSCNICSSQTLYDSNQCIWHAGLQRRGESSAPWHPQGSPKAYSAGFFFPTYHPSTVVQPNIRYHTLKKVLKIVWIHFFLSLISILFDLGLFWQKTEKCS